MIRTPTGYSPAEDGEQEALARADAWSSYDIDGDDDEVLVHWRTNDNLDYGYPTEYADDTYTVRSRDGQSAILRALGIAGGGSRMGIGQACFVRVNGTLVVETP